MAITRRVCADGSVSYKAQVRKMRAGRTVQRTRTFKRKALAKAWEARTLAEFESTEDLLAADHSAVTVGDLIEGYMDDYGERFGRTKHLDIKKLLKADLSAQKALSLQSGDIIDHVRLRRLSAGPATVLNDLVWLKAVWKYARTAKGIQLDYAPLDDALEFCRAERLVAKAKKRDRRPTQDELDQLTAYFETKRGTYPMVDIMWFAIHSARRQAEICGLLWADNQDDEMTGLVRDAKHPRSKEGNHRRFKYTREAWEIVQRQPREDERIFPYDPKTVGAYFTHACHVLEIEDLRFHDLRHDATSRLFEAGYTIVQVQQFTLHENWNTLKRYTHLRPGDVKHR